MNFGIKRGIIVAIGLLLQIILFLFAYLYLGEQFAIFNVFYKLLGLLIVLGLIRFSKSYSYILPWIIIILIFPIMGTLLYIIIGRNMKTSRLLKRITKNEKDMPNYLIQDEKLRKDINNNGRIRYLTDFAKYPVTTNNEVEYYPIGEEAFKEMIKELKKAKEFIFFEYFIVNRGKMWETILNILKAKAASGVDVRVMYDDLGSLTTLDKYYPKELEAYGIKCVVFNKLSPLSGIIMNNRDHRKILVIDGKVAFSGGINIADEYINEIERFGHWKDNGIKVVGDAVWNYTVMFLTMWNSIRKTDNDYNVFKRDSKDKESKGYVIPYGETPLDEEIVGQNVYLNIINQANKYVYICTPYLIIDQEMQKSLVLAAQRGVDVRIIIPGIPDKKIVYSVSESYVEALINGGVKVYKYTPGFIHGKVFVSDDNIATVGTINLDYRSLYLHFECGLYMENVKCIKDIKKDMEDTINKSQLLNIKDIKPNIIKGMIQVVLRLIAPLM